MSRNRFPSRLICMVALLSSAWVFPRPAPALTEAAAPAAPGNLSVKGNLAPTPALMNLAMVENRGQLGPEVRYYGRGNGQGVYFTREEAVLLLARPTPGEVPDAKTALTAAMDAVRAEFKRQTGQDAQ